MRVVLDASGLLSLLNSEPGAAAVRDMLPHAVMSAVNLSEVISKLAGEGIPKSDIEEALDGLDLEVVPFDFDQAYSAGLLSPMTRSQGLSLGDRACIALGFRLGLPVLTADRVWSTLDLGVEVRLAR